MSENSFFLTDLIDSLPGNRIWSHLSHFYPNFEEIASLSSDIQWLMMIILMPIWFICLQMWFFSSLKSFGIFFLFWCSENFRRIFWIPVIFHFLITVLAILWSPAILRLTPFAFIYVIFLLFCLHSSKFPKLFFLVLLLKVLVFMMINGMCQLG